MKISVAKFAFRLVLAVSVLSVTPSYANTVTDAQHQSEQIMRDQQFRAQEDRQRMESNRPSSKIEAPLPAMPHGIGTGCFKIDVIKLKGANNMSKAQQDKIIQPYLHKCLGVEEVQSILSQITSFYINIGLTTTRAYLPEQDMSSKVLRIEIMEGKVEKIHLQKGDQGSLYLPWAFPGLKHGSILNLRDIEQGLDQVNRLPSNNATVDIAPGKQPGTSDVTIRNTPGDRLHVSTSVDNYGTRNTGEQEASTTVGLDDLAGYNDQLSITGRRSTSIDTWDRYSNAVNGFYSVPYGYSTVTLGFSYSEYESKLFTAGPTLRLNGDSSSEFIAVDHTLYRGQTGKLTASGTLTAKQQSNFIANNKLDVSSRPLTVFDLGTAYSTTIAGGASSLGITWSRGLGILNAYHDPAGTPKEGAHAEFSKIALNGSWSRPFTLADQNLTWSSQLNYQHAAQSLYGTEQISIGGYYNVRGFYEESLANDNGEYMRNDLSLRKSLGSLWGQDVIAKPYIALDGGSVDGNTGTPHGVLLGTGIGASVTAGKATFEIFSGRPLMQPDSFGQIGVHTLARLTIAFQ